MPNNLSYKFEKTVLVVNVPKFGRRSTTVNEENVITVLNKCNCNKY